MVSSSQCKIIIEFATNFAKNVNLLWSKCVRKLFLVVLGRKVPCLLKYQRDIKILIKTPMAVF